MIKKSESKQLCQKKKKVVLQMAQQMSTLCNVAN